jgi:predicted alpha-1,2-mannosidase
MQVSFPPVVKDKYNNAYNQNRRISIVLNEGDDVSEVSVNAMPDGTITLAGYTTANNGGVADNFKSYFVAAIYSGESGNTPLKASQLIASGADSKWVYVDIDATQETSNVYTVRIATSFISADQAIFNLQSEVGIERTYDDVVAESKEEWNNVLSKVDIQSVGQAYSPKDQEDYLTTFYSSMYRASLFPRQITEVDKNNKVVHWSPYDGKVREGDLSSDSGAWDAWNTVFPLLTLINPTQLSTSIRGFLQAYTEGGWLPKWPSPGYRDSMVGTMGDVVIADAIVKGIKGFDTALAYEALRKDAFTIPPSNSNVVGRVCLPSYDKYGYIPTGSLRTDGQVCDQVVSRTLNYMHSDYAIAEAAKLLGHDDDVAALEARASNYSLLFDTNTAFFRGRDVKTHNYTDTFDQFRWNGDYTEACAWQYRFYLPYDAAGLKKLYTHAGRDICEEMEKAQTTPSIFHVYPGQSVQHEQTELSDHGWGQYLHNNQPAHHMLYMFGAVDDVSDGKSPAAGYRGQCSARGQYWIRKTLTDLYTAGADMYPGDEDNGEMAAWFILSSLGLYSQSPGSPHMALGSPLFEKVVLHLEGDDGSSPTLTILAKNNGPRTPYVQSVYFNDNLIENTNKVEYKDLMKGGELIFEMGEQPYSVSHP